MLFPEPLIKLSVSCNVDLPTLDQSHNYLVFLAPDPPIQTPDYLSLMYNSFTGVMEKIKLIASMPIELPILIRSFRCRSTLIAVRLLPLLLF